MLLWALESFRFSFKTQEKPIKLEPHLFGKLGAHPPKASTETSSSSPKEGDHCIPSGQCGSPPPVEVSLRIQKLPMVKPGLHEHEIYQDPRNGTQWWNPEMEPRNGTSKNFSTSMGIPMGWQNLLLGTVAIILGDDDSNILLHLLTPSCLLVGEPLPTSFTPPPLQPSYLTAHFGTISTLPVAHQDRAPAHHLSSSHVLTASEGSALGWRVGADAFGFPVVFP